MDVPGEGAPRPQASGAGIGPHSAGGCADAVPAGGADLSLLRRDGLQALSGRPERLYFWSKLTPRV
jgi:hypothetical protein